MKRLIKYAALLFALLLSASIIGGCLTAGVEVIKIIVDKTEAVTENNRADGNGIWYREEDGDVVFLGIRFGSNTEVKSGSELFDGSEIDSLYIEGISGNLIVEVWDNDAVSVEYENLPGDYEIVVSNRTLIMEKKGSIFFWDTVFKKSPKIRVSVPANRTFEEVEVDTGSGSTKITGISAGRMFVDTGSGGVTISGVTAEKCSFNSGSGSFAVRDSRIGETSLDTGSGFVNFENITAENLVLETGSGRVDIKGVLTGNSVFESGSGSLNVVIYGKEEDYNIRTDLGSGSFYLNGDRVKDDHMSHTGADHLLVFDAGSGRVSVEFKPVPEAMSEDTDGTAKESFDRSR